MSGWMDRPAAVPCPMTYRALLETLDQWFERGCRAAGRGAEGGPVVPCRSGCSACCHGVFDLSPADAALVAEGVLALAPAAREALAARAHAQLLRYAEHLPDWRSPWDVETLDEDTFDRLAGALAHDPCPALDSAGGCVVYTHRPATCRMLGLGMVSPELGELPNECPIQAEHPEYAALPPTPFDLLAFERASVALETDAAAAGRHSTTVAAAVWLTASPAR
jgi:Fe-S-cluster containining protein